jgi:LysM repeat protein
MDFRTIGLVALLALAACAAPSPVPPTVTLLPLPSGTPIPAGTRTPPPTPIIIASPTPSATPVTHTVARNETLISIAVDYGVSLEALQTANPGVSPRFLGVGTVLVIPAGDGTPIAPVGAPTPLPVVFGVPACHALSSGAMYCFVEARNANAVALEAISARITLAGADGLPLADALAHPALDAVPAGDAVTLAAYFGNAPGDVAAVGVAAVSAYPLTDFASRYLSLEVSGPRAAQSGAEWAVTAQLRNDGPTRAATIRVALTLFDEAGAIIGYRQQTLPGGLAPGEAQTVSIAATPLCGAGASPACAGGTRSVSSTPLCGAGASPACAGETRSVSSTPLCGAVARYTLRAQGRP